MAKVNSVCTSEKVDHKGASEYVRAYNAHCPYVAREATILRPPKTTALDEALEKPHAARQDFAQACAGMLAQRDLRAGEQALAT